MLTRVPASSRSRALIVVAAGTAAVAVAAWVAFSLSLFETRLPAGTTIDRIVVHKSSRRMVVFEADQAIAEYAIGIGNGAPGPKLMEGDRRTPEGEYRIDARHRSVRFHRFLHISYPNPADETRFRTLKTHGDIAPHARIGGAVGIHGQPWWADWFPWATTWGATAGCISVHNREIEELYTAVAPNAEITIFP